MDNKKSNSAVAYNDNYAAQTVIECAGNAHLYVVPAQRPIAYVYEDKPAYEKIKRVFDIVLSCLALVIFCPMMIIVAIAIVLDDPNGSPIYSQMRAGRYGRPFKFYKYRSMVVNADDMKKSSFDKNEMDWPVFKIRNDSRITKLGHVLRKTSIDELPQLWNVLRGEMSIVGPRPLLVEESQACNPYQSQRLNVMPGLTCYWQCSGRSNICFSEWVRMDLQYIADRSLWTDFKIILKTIPAVIKMTGAI